MQSHGLIRVCGIMTQPIDKYGAAQHQTHQIYQLGSQEFVSTTHLTYASHQILT